MSTNITTHTISDNKLLVAKEDGTNSEYTGLGVSKIILGVENEDGVREIQTDSSTGYNYSRVAVEAQEIYCLNTQKHHSWFILDLETGQHGWYPGCEIHGSIVSDNTLVKETPDDNSSTLETLLANDSVVVLEIETLDQEPYTEGWYKVKFLTEGYVKKDQLKDLRYANPNTY